ncbi:ferredoxin [Streptomyces canus]|uniref:Ferredoxin n=1 Tax=Streptomyces canus TaxID=58343 RepID=A0AAW8F5R9_9ACTN|nr:ferredoxin [Streptomyces canus]
MLSGRLDTGRLLALIDGLIDARDADLRWLCGPHGMVRDARAVLSGLGVPADRVHQELFHADEEPPARTTADHDGATDDRPTSEVTVVLDGRATTFSAPRHGTVLDGAQQVRPDLPFACKGGVCGTCRALVTQGRADIRRNYALEPAEVDELCTNMEATLCGVKTLAGRPAGHLRPTLTAKAPRSSHERRPSERLGRADW